MSDTITKTKSGRAKVSVRRHQSNEYEIYAKDRQVRPYFYGDARIGRWFDVQSFLSHLADYRELRLVRTVKLDGVKVVRVQRNSNEQTDAEIRGNLARLRAEHLAERKRMAEIGKAVPVKLDLARKATTN